MSKIKLKKYVYFCECGYEWNSAVRPNSWGEVCKECGEFASWQGKMFDEVKNQESLNWTTEQLPNLMEQIIENKEKYKLEFILLIVAGIFFFATQLITNKAIAIPLQLVIITFVLSLLNTIRIKTKHNV